MIGNVDLVLPGLHKELLREANGMPMTLRMHFDKLEVCSGVHNVGIGFDTLRALMERDDYSGINRAAGAAVRYLRSLIQGNREKVRAFKRKRVAIHVRQRFG